MFLDSLADLSQARLLFFGVAGLAALLAAEPPPEGAGETAAPVPAAATSRRAGLAGPFEAQALRVIDGDTFEARVRVWIGQEIQVLVRLRGVDAPELTARCAQEGRRAIAARDYLAMVLGTGALRLRDIALDKYGGRIVAAASVTDEAAGAEDVAALLLASGHARPYGGARRASWCAHGTTKAANRPGGVAAPEVSDAGRSPGGQSPPSFPSLSAQR